jgi:hypothetical protein
MQHSLQLRFTVRGFAWQWITTWNVLICCLVAGAACHAAEPGFFRMCWAWPHPGSIPTAVGRIAAAVKQFKQAQRDVRQQHAAVDQMQKAQLQQQQQILKTAADGAGACQQQTGKTGAV